MIHSAKLHYSTLKVKRLRECAAAVSPENGLLLKEHTLCSNLQYTSYCKDRCH